MSRRGSTLDVPVNIHLTGCHNSCAQHYIGDIGLIGAKVPVNADGDTVDGYDIVVGGGFARGGPDRPRALEGRARRGLPRRAIEALLRTYLAHRLGAGRELPGLHRPPRHRGAARTSPSRRRRWTPPHELHAAAARSLLIPENAPFTPEQRAWLSGYFARSSSPGGGADGARRGARRLPGARPPTLADNDDAPWHDPAMPLDERMTLAEARPLAARLMAAMAQQDCGQCGYNCADYANALFLEKEERLNLCAPGGKDTFAR